MSAQLNDWHLLRYLKYMITYYLKPTSLYFWNARGDKASIPERVKVLSNFMLLYTDTVRLLHGQGGNFGIYRLERVFLFASLRSTSLAPTASVSTVEELCKKRQMRRRNCGTQNHSSCFHQIKEFHLHSPDSKTGKKYDSSL